MEKLVFVSQYPDNDGRDGGHFRRIISIDKQFGEVERLYLDISFYKHLREIVETHDNNVKVIKMNIIIHFFRIFNILRKASIVYVQTLGNSLRILPFYFIFKNIISDIHGVVSEEIYYYGDFNLISKYVRFLLYRFIEYVVSQRSYGVVVVTESMKEYIIHTYSSRTRFFVVPIFNEYDELKIDLRNKNKNKYIYAGGLNGWQKIDLMLDVIYKKIKTDSNSEFEILSSGYKSIKSRIENIDKNKQIKLGCVSPKELYLYYKDACWGFVLRDDNAVNRVACPTKLIEYMKYGIIPIVKSPYLGDFESMGYKYIDYKAIDSIEDVDIGYYAGVNKNILWQLEKRTYENLNILVDEIKNKLYEKCMR